MMANFMLGSSLHFDPVTLDDRVREQLVGNFGGERLGLSGFGGREIELEVLPLPNIFHAGIAERMQRVGNRAPLRIEHRWLQRDEYSRAHHLLIGVKTGHRANLPGSPL